MVVPEVDIVLKYFDLKPEIVSQLEMLGPLYSALNQKINVISRKDIDSLYLHHVLHSLALSKINRFEPGDKILDLGTGGGFPGIPLAIMFPDCQFTLIDGTQKKIGVVKSIVERVGLSNVQASAVRAENLNGQFDYVVSRAVAKALTIREWCKQLLPQKGDVQSIYLLKGGDLTDEIQALSRNYTLQPLHLFFEEAYFKEKYILAF